MSSELMFIVLFVGITLLGMFFIYIAFVCWDDDNAVPAVLAGSFLLVTGIITSNAASQDYGYRRGQIDAVNDKMEYELVEQPDGTRDWERIKK